MRGRIYISSETITLRFLKITIMRLGRILLDPLKTPGICHVPGLSNESADMASRCLQANRSNHIFTTSEKEMGVSHLSLNSWIRLQPEKESERAVRISMDKST
jgi:hypothetical protein